MNRIEQIATCGKMAPSESEIRIDANTFSAVASSDCVSFIPLHYEPGYAYPLLVWLHGADEDEHQLKTIMPQLSMRNFVAVGPRGPAKTANSGRMRPSYTWPVGAERADEVEQRIFAAVDLAFDRANISPDRVFLAGMADGGTAAIRIAFRYPDRFAGVLSLGGPVPTGDAPLCRLIEARRLPLLLACGQESQIYPSQRMCDDLRLFHAAGMSIDLRLYPGDDEMMPRMLADANCWIMEKVTGEQSTTAGTRDRQP